MSILLPFLLLTPAVQSPDALLVKPIDIDRDGRVDLWFPEEGRLFWNAGNLQYPEATVGSGLEGTGTQGPSIWEDFDLDGDLDLLIAGPTGVRLLVQGTGLSFHEVERGAFPTGRIEGAKWIEDEAGGRPSLLLVGPAGLALLAPVGATGFAPAHIPALGAGSIVLAQASVFACTKSIKDQAGGNCIQASSVPQLGLLYPLSQAFFVAPDGRIGMGTTTPTERVSVEGIVESRLGGFRFPDGSLQATAQLVGPAGPAGPNGPKGDPGSTSWLGLTDIPTDLQDGDDDTTYTAGVGTQITGTQLHFDTVFGDSRYWNESQPLGGDLAGAPGAALVGGLQGRAVSAANPLIGHVLKWNGFSWSPNVDNDTNTTYAAGTGLALSGTTFSLASSGVASTALASDGASLAKVTAGLASISGSSLRIDTTDSSGKLNVQSASSTTSPQIKLIQSGASAFARLGFSNVASSQSWTLAGGLGATSATDRLNFFHSTAGDVLSISGQGRIGVNTTNPLTGLHVIGSLHLQGTGQDISVPAGESLQVGHFDGTTFTEHVRIEASGTLRTQGDVVVGGNLSLPTTTRWVTLLPAKFAPRRDLADVVVLGNETGYLALSSVPAPPPGLGGIATAQLDLPQGAVVQSFSARLLDQSSGSNLDVYLRRQALNDSGGGWNDLATVGTSGFSSQVQTLSDTTIQNATVDNQTYVYYVKASFDYVLPTTDLRLHNVQVVYTVASPLP